DQPTIGLGFRNTIIVQRNTGQGIFVDDTWSLMHGTTATSVIPMAGTSGYAAHAPAGESLVNYVVSQTGPNLGNYTIQRVNADRSVNQVTMPIMHNPGNGLAVRNGPYVIGYPLTSDPQDVLIDWTGKHLYIVSSVLNGIDKCQRVTDLFDVSATPFGPQNR